MTNFAMAEGDRRLANIVIIGVIEEIDYAATPPAARVRDGDLLTGHLPMAMARAGPDRDWHPYEIGEQVVAICPSGDPTNGVIIAAINSDQHPQTQNSPTMRSVDFADGAHVSYDRAAQHMTVNIAGGTLAVTATGGITINGDIMINGNVQLNGRMDASDDVVADGISLITHLHSNVASGNAKTGKPE